MIPWLHVVIFPSISKRNSPNLVNSLTGLWWKNSNRWRRSCGISFAFDLWKIPLIQKTNEHMIIGPSVTGITTTMFLSKTIKRPTHRHERQSSLSAVQQAKCRLNTYLMCAWWHQVCMLQSLVRLPQKWPLTLTHIINLFRKLHLGNLVSISIWLTHTEAYP